MTFAHLRPVIVLLGELSRGADELIHKPCQINRLGIGVELAGLDLREVQYLVDEAQKVGSGGIHTAQRFERLSVPTARRYRLRTTGLPIARTSPAQSRTTATTSMAGTPPRRLPTAGR
jgi:hypothetical protein